MPRGTLHVETGILRCDGRGYLLERDGGGTWRLDLPGSGNGFIGQRVTVEGIRSGFDLLDVTRIRRTPYRRCRL